MITWKEFEDFVKQLEKDQSGKKFADWYDERLIKNKTFNNAIKEELKRLGITYKKK